MAIYEIGPFRLDAAAKAVTRAGAPVALGPRAVAVLALLVESAQEYVSKTRLMDEAWPDVIVEEANLAVQIWAIRRAFAAAPGGAHWIETLAKRGYRFVGPVTRLDNISQHAAAAASPRSNLTEASTSFVGRGRELAELRVLLADRPLLTLIGAGGVGKTRLAMHAAASLTNDYGDGVWLVELAALSDPGLVCHALATVLGVKEQRRKDVTASLTGYLASKRLLLVLDNAEHLLTATARLTEAILRECPQVKLLVTSREQLGLPQETTYRVPSLSIPGSKRDAAAQSILEYESVRLFSERARLQRPHFAVAEQSASAVASICRRLDGIPLAIELAAARMRSMPVEEIDRRLQRGFNLLTGGSRAALPRQQTLRAAIDWSYDLLSDAEKALFRRLSVFSGGWTLEAAESICTDESLDQEDVLDLLTSLVDKSLAVADEHDGSSRYRLLETLRQYARERCVESGEQIRLRERHLAYFLQWVEQTERLLKGPEQQTWLDRLESEHGNIRQALDWVVAGGDIDAGLRVAGAVSWFWEVHGHLEEGRRWLSGFLDVAHAPQARPVRAKALQGAGQLALRQGDFAAAESLLQESLAMHRELGDPRSVSLTLRSLGIVAYERGQYSTARVLAEESLAIQRGLGDRVSVATTLNNLGNVAIQQGDYAAARARFEESLALQRDLDNRLGISMALNNLGWVACAEGAYCAAHALHTESLAIRRDIGDRVGIAGSLNNLGNVVFAQGHYADAQALLEEGLLIRRDLGDRWGLAWSLEALANVALAVGRPHRAARIWGYAERLREDIGSPLPPAERIQYDRRIAMARAALGDGSAFDLAWQEGRSMTLEHAIDYALNDEGDQPRKPESAGLLETCDAPRGTGQALKSPSSPACARSARNGGACAKRRRARRSPRRSR